MTWKIPLFVPDFDERDAEAVAAPVRDGWLTMGERTRQLEERFARTTGSRFAFAVGNGTASIQLALAAIKIQPGDRVLLPSLTFIACANAVRTMGAEPVFVDIVSESDWTLSPGDLERKITPACKAVMAVHYAGFPCHMERIQAIAHDHHLSVIEDCAHALFTKHENRYCGTWGDVGCFSFFSNKNMTCGEGGMATAQDESMAERMRLMRSHGMTTLTLDRHKGHAFSYDVLETGYNFRLDEIRSALAMSQMDKLEGFLTKRREIYKRYVEFLRDVEDIMIPFLDRAIDSTGIHIFPILLRHADTRTAFMQALKDQGIQTSIHYPAIHRFSAYEPYKANAACLITETVCSAEVTLPFYPSMTEEDIETVCQAVKEALSQIG